jgi:pimeloyl-ACP methyl ester carboxylesterase
VKRLLLVLAATLVAAFALPPLWFAVFPHEAPPPLPPPGERVVLPGGVGVNVVAEGSGPAVVLVHGLPGSAYDWRSLAPELAARGRRAVPYDRVGYGHSDPRGDGRYTPQANAEELLALLEALQIEDATVVGWSYGGVTAIFAAAADPSRIRRLVLVGSGGPDSPDAEPPEMPLAMRVLYSDPVLRWRTAVPPLGIALMKTVSDAAFSGQPQPAWWLAGLRGNFSRWDTLVTYRSEMAGVGAEGEAPDDFPADRVRVPTLLLHGDEDRLAPIAIARTLHSMLPESELVEIAGGSHMIPITHAAQLAGRIAAF